MLATATAALLLSHAVAEPLTPPEILQGLRSFGEMGTVLYVAAHPDDENTQLIAYFARGRGFRTAYLSVTRGDGGQNVLGPEFGDELGVIRTQELLAARRVDGGRQFFTRAIDFGFSKDYRETLQIWNRHEVVGDIVRVIRTFRPDVIITRFSPQPGNTHGHHTSSAVLAEEAFKLAGDPKAYPEQLTTLTPWQPKRILMNSGGFVPGIEGAKTLHLESDGEDPVTGKTLGELAGRSRSMHKTQGFGNFTGGGGRGRTENFQLLAGTPATNDLFEDIDTTWSRVPGGAKVEKLAADALANFDTNKPAASIPALLELRKTVATLPQDPVVQEKFAQLGLLLQACLGLEVQTGVPNAEMVPGETLNLVEKVQTKAGTSLRWKGVRYPLLNKEIKVEQALQPGAPASHMDSETLPAQTPLTQPYWLRKPHGVGMFEVEDTSLIGRPENPPTFPVDYIFDLEGQPLVISDSPVQTDGSARERGRHLDVIPPVSLHQSAEVKLFAPGSTQDIEVELTAARAGVDGQLSLSAPSDWQVAPANQSFHVGEAGGKQKLTFRVTAPGRPAIGQITAVATIKGAKCDNDRIEIRYPHIPVQLLQPPATVKAVSLDLKTDAHRVGYIPGAGDSVAECLEQMGCQVTRLTGDDLQPEKLKGLDAVVVGVRAFNVRRDLEANITNLFAYANSGGTVIVQYNRPLGQESRAIAPYDLHISNDRVTDETAHMTLLVPDSPVFNAPNKITDDDFNGWVQERGLYFPNTWDEHFTPLLACNDPGEEPKKGSLLVARTGKGYYVYTGLAWFRQLPAGVPGAYRLFANLLSLSKTGN